MSYHSLLFSCGTLFLFLHCYDMKGENSYRIIQNGLDRERNRYYCVSPLCGTYPPPRKTFVNRIYVLDDRAYIFIVANCRLSNETASMFVYEVR
ncbi:hypothetical protein PF004_g16041 [Phytophthora fragariae]|uniref:Uncharacterized protein n=1 Tax=Phytophthora fragariae TaxID=53985 RepID=A0A6A3EE86_9STRA|nr:hypothetical protein PF009_g17893 [Phytophthora fragariae]KAE9211007.1 hypothetical protein PF004_g16041 [Phytophthora fragariae]